MRALHSATGPSRHQTGCGRLRHVGVRALATALEAQAREPALLRRRPHGRDHALDAEPPPAAMAHRRVRPRRPIAPGGGDRERRDTAAAAARSARRPEAGEGGTVSNRDLPMMPWYPDQFAASTVAWTWLERSLYRCLLDVQWQLGSIPTEPARISLCVGFPEAEFKAAWPAVSKKFVKVHGKLINKRLEYHRLKALERKEKAASSGSSGGKASAAAKAKRRSSKPQATLQANANPPTPSPTPVEEHPQPPQGGRAGLTANGGGRKPREERDASLNGWREIAPVLDDIASTASLPPDQRRTWADVGKHCTDPIAVRAAEQVGFRAIADRDKFTTTELQTRFREAYERLARSEAHA